MYCICRRRASYLVIRLRSMTASSKSFRQSIARELLLVQIDELRAEVLQLVHLSLALVLLGDVV